jgi:hypothetical protein
MKKRKNIRWSLVDLTRPAAEIAEELGTHPNAVYAARKRAGIVTENLSGGMRPNSHLPKEGAGRPKLAEDKSIKMSYVRMLPAEIEALKKHAKRQKLTYSELVRLILQKYLREQEALTHGEKALD